VSKVLGIYENNIFYRRFGNNQKILKHLDLWEVRPKPTPRANDPPNKAFIICDQSSSPGSDDYLIDVGYPMVTYL